MKIRFNNKKKYWYKPALERELVLSNVTINGGEDRYKPLS